MSRTVAKRLQPRRKPSQERSRETVDAILEATIQVFTQVGYDQGTIGRIAARAGVSVGSLYQYFPGKDALVIALMERHSAETASRIASMATAPTPPATLLQTIQLFVHTMLEVYTRQPRLIQVLFQVVPRTVAIHAAQAAIMASVAKQIAQFLQAYPEVAVPDLTLASETVVSLIDAQTRNIALLPMFSAPAEQVEAELCRVVYRYLTGKPGPDELNT